MTKEKYIVTNYNRSFIYKKTDDLSEAISFARYRQEKHPNLTYYVFDNREHKFVFNTNELSKIPKFMEMM